MYKSFIKRMLDILLSLCAIIALSPVLLMLFILVRVLIGSPVFFKQKRPGKNEKIFTLYKFRTMTEEKDEYGHYLPDNIRLNKFGRFLRSTSLDELPELWNILKGDMSIVGPRPLLVEYLPLYNNEQKRRHDVRPGLTGLAQINGRNAITWEDKFINDVRYVDSVSFLLDVKIIAGTVMKVLKREGISQQGHDTSEVFAGNINQDKEKTNA